MNDKPTAAELVARYEMALQAILQSGYDHGSMRSIAAKALEG